VVSPAVTDAAAGLCGEVAPFPARQGVL